MKTTKMFLLRVIRDQSGQDLVEYALILVLISLGATAGMHSLANVLAAIPYRLMQMFNLANAS
jgi:Flp pilus assembly pilin Flp